MAESCRQAGYSRKSAKQQGHIIMTDTDCKVYIQRLREAKQAQTRFTREEVRAALIKIIQGEKTRNSDAIKSADILAKIDGHYAPAKQEITTHDGDRGAEDIKLLKQAQYEALQDVNDMLGSNGDSEARDTPD